MSTKPTRSAQTKVAEATNLFARLGPITYRCLSELKPYSRNPRQHSERQLIGLVASIREFGFIVPVLIADDDEVVAGAARVAAASRAGLSEVPTIRASHLSAAQIKAYRLADNRLPELASWDLDLLAVELAEIVALDEMTVDVLGWNTAEIDVILAGNTGDPAEADPDDVAAEPPAAPVSCLGDLWLLGRHRLLCASSLESTAWDRLLDGKLAAMAFVDPPYNVAINGHVSGLGKARHAEFAMASGEMTEDQFTQFLTAFLTPMTTYLHDGAVIDICMDWRHLRELLTAIQSTGLSLINLCVWNKSNGGLGGLYRSKHELVLIAKKGLAAHINNVELGKHGRNRTNVWDYAGVNSFGRARNADLADHPTVKPIALVADAIRDVSRHGDIVLDAFMGSGTTLLAAERTGRVGYGIEIAPGYVDVAVRRWEAMTGSQARLEATGQTMVEIATARAEDAVPATLAEAA